MSWEEAGSKTKVVSDTIEQGFYLCRGRNATTPTGLEKRISVVSDYCRFPNPLALPGHVYTGGVKIVH
jgi:hypothetical protein